MTEHVAVLREPWLSRLLDGTKRAECRVGTRPPRAGRAKAGDVVHLRPVGGAPVACMTVERVYDFGRVAARDMRRIARAYASALGSSPADVERHLLKHDSAYVVLVWLADPRPSTLTSYPRFQPWATLR